MANDKQKLPEGFVPDEGQDLSEFVPDASAVPPSQEGTMEAAPSMLSRAGSFLKGGHPLDALGAITTEPLEKAGAEMKMRGQGTPSELANIYATEGGALAAPEDALAGVKMIEDLPKMGDMLAHVVRGAEAVLPSKVKGWIPGVKRWVIGPKIVWERSSTRRSSRRQCRHGSTPNKAHRAPTTN